MVDVRQETMEDGHKRARGGLEQFSFFYSEDRYPDVICILYVQGVPYWFDKIIDYRLV